MKRFGITTVAFLITVISFAQKPIIDFDAIKKWIYIGGEAISDDGQYVFYYINRQPVDGRTLVVQSTQSDWKREFINASAPAFADDSKTIQFKTSGDSSWQLTLATGDLQYLPVIKKERDASIIADGQSFEKRQDEKTESMEEPVQIEIYSYLNHTKKKDKTVLGKAGDYVLVRNGPAFDGLYESSWNRSDQWSCYLVHAKDSSRKLIKDHITNPEGVPALSPSGKFVIYYDFDKHNYYSYESRTGILRNITKDCCISWLKEDNGQIRSSLTWGPWRQTWLADDEAVLLYDNYDIWLIDPSCNKKPLNLTNGFGHKHHIQFQVMNEDDVLKNASVKEKEVLILTAINNETKDRGFYRIALGICSNPELLTMGPYIYGDWISGYAYPPLKAKNAEVYLVYRQSTNEAPNLFVTKDLKKFTRLTDIHPQTNVNWLSAELVRWKAFDGNISTGILYKPENFDPSKKYPVIFNYYEQRSQEFNLFRSPFATGSNINISWFVSRGYLVFVPDIHYKIGKIGQSAYNYIVSAALYLAQKSWVDATHMGLQGHSFGAYETNYVITHTNIFAAACSASGMCDLVSFYGSDAPFTHPLYWVEQGQGRMGATLWQRPELYISNSPIFKADKVSTPLLMMNNKLDRQVPYEQGVEFFTALRRLGKKVWMLQYDDGGHELGGGKSAEDYTIRMTQFFDYYLRGEPAPKWMEEGVPGEMKGIDDELELTPAGINPGSGLLLKDEKSNKTTK